MNVLPSIRCYACGKVLGNKHEAYTSLYARYVQSATAMAPCVRELYLGKLGDHRAVVEASPHVFLRAIMTVRDPEFWDAWLRFHRARHLLSSASLASWLNVVPSLCVFAALNTVGCTRTCCRTAMEFPVTRSDLDADGWRPELLLRNTIIKRKTRTGVTLIRLPKRSANGDMTEYPPVEHAAAPTVH